MVEQLEDIKGYSDLSIIDRLKFAVGLKFHLDSIDPKELDSMDILDVHKSKLGKSVYYCTFLFKNGKHEDITIKFKKNMMYKKK